MGWTLGIPSLKLNNVGKKSKHCGSFGGVAMEALEERKGRDPDINRELSHLNVYSGYTSAKELMEYSRKHVEELSEQRRAVGERGIREDAVVMCSTVIKPPAEMMASLSQEDQIKFLKDAQKKLLQIVGENNARASAIHLDEQGAHLHQFWEPMTEDGRLCAKELHNIKFFGRLNREMPEYLRSCGWDIDDCNAYDAAKEELENDEERKAQRKKNGRSSAVYKRDMEREAKQLKAELEKKDLLLQEKEKQYEEILAINEKNLEKMNKNERIIRAQEEALQLIKDYNEYRAEAAQIDQDMDLLEAAAKEMPEAKKLFQQAAATTWLQRMSQILLDIRRLIEAGIRRLKIFENIYVVENRLSEPAEKRKEALDKQIFGGEARKVVSGTSEPEKESHH